MATGIRPSHHSVMARGASATPLMGVSHNLGQTGAAGIGTGAAAGGGGAGAIGTGASGAATTTGTRVGIAGAQRTTKTTQKLKLLPEETNEGATGPAYANQTAAATARRDAERFGLGKYQRGRLPRVTAYCTASSYRMEALHKFLNGRTDSHGSDPKVFDECIYSPYGYRPSKPSADLLTGLDEQREDIQSEEQSEVFLFEYGVCVIWGMSVVEEVRFLKEIERFEVEKLSADNVEVEEFNYFITSDYQPRIYNDVITLKEARNYMIKIAISHAIAQSVKISLFEELVENTIEIFKDIPDTIAETGKVQMNRKTIMMNVGELFILRININLVGSVLDNPELFWSEPQLDPMYQAARSYLEINQRVSLLNQRVDVISDLLQLLKQQISYSHSEYLEWIVIILIALEIFIAIVNILVDWVGGGQ